MIARVITAAWIAAAAIGAQEPAESRAATRPRIEALGGTMTRVRAGDSDVDAVRAIVDALMASEHAMAAAWWPQLVWERAMRMRFTGSEKEALGRARMAAQRPEAEPAARKVTLRLIRLAEAHIASKEYEDARRAIRAAYAFLDLVPDPVLMRLLSGAQERTPEPEEESQATRPWPPALAAEALAEYKAVLGRTLAAYEAAGCRPGRVTIARSLRDAAVFLDGHDAAKYRAQLRATAAAVEPDSRMTVMLRSVGTATFIVDGQVVDVSAQGEAFDAATHEPVHLPVIPGDIVTIALDESYAADGQAHTYLVAVNARLDGRDLPETAYRCDTSARPGRAGALLRKAPIARLRAADGIYELPPTEARRVEVPCGDEMKAFLADFAARKLAPTVLGTEANRFAVVVLVPER